REIPALATRPQNGPTSGYAATSLVSAANHGTPGMAAYPYRPFLTCVSVTESQAAGTSSPRVAGCLSRFGQLVPAACVLRADPPCPPDCVAGAPVPRFDPPAQHVGGGPAPQQCAQIVQLGRAGRVGGEQHLGERREFQRLGDHGGGASPDVVQ